MELPRVFFILCGKRYAFGDLAAGKLPKRGDCRVDYEIATFHSGLSFLLLNMKISQNKATDREPPVQKTIPEI
jgi:hypothetical protein